MLIANYYLLKQENKVLIHHYSLIRISITLLKWVNVFNLRLCSSKKLENCFYLTLLSMVPVLSITFSSIGVSLSIQMLISFVIIPCEPSRMLILVWYLSSLYSFIENGCWVIEGFTLSLSNLALHSSTSDPKFHTTSWPLWLDLSIGSFRIQIFIITFYESCSYMYLFLISTLA